MQATIDENRKSSDEKMKEYGSKIYKQDSKLDKLTSMIENDGSEFKLKLLTILYGYTKGPVSYHCGPG